MSRLARRSALVAIVLAVAACGSPASGGPSNAGPGGSPAPSVNPAASLEPGVSAEPVASDNQASPSASSTRDRALEAMLPDTFDGVPFLRQSMRLSEVSGPTGDATPVEAIVAALNADPAVVSMAFAADPTQTSQVQFVAYRFPGVAATKLIGVLTDAGTQSGDTVKRATLGGKQVVELIDPSAPDSVTYLYTKTDVLLGVVAPDDATATKALQRLP